MHPPTINHDVICQQAIQAKLNVHQAKEHFESVLKIYNDQVDNLINLVAMMKNRILELEEEKGGRREEKQHRSIRCRLIPSGFSNKSSTSYKEGIMPNLQVPNNLSSTAQYVRD